MYSISETIEFEILLVTASPSIWIVDDILYWPPEGTSINRRILVHPGSDWKPYKCKVLKTNIETFEEAIELEKKYSKHRDSTSFHEYQAQQKMKRKHPVNYDESNFDLIDVNDMVKKINGNAGANDLGSGVSTQKSRYHQSCKGSTSVDPKMKTVKKPELSKLATTSAKSNKEKVHGSVQAVKKNVKKPLPFQNNYLKSGISKAKDRVASNVAKPKRPRYDNFLKSGTRSNGVPAKVRAKDNVPSSTITKDQYLKQNGNTSEYDPDDEDGISAPETIGRASTPVETQPGNYHKNYNFANSFEDYLNVSNNSADQPFAENKTSIINESDIENLPKNSVDVANLKKVHVLEDIPIRPATKISSQGGMSFEERILKELCDLKKTQESFEARIDKKIETFFNDQPRMQGNSQSRMQSNGQSRMQANGQSRMQANGQSRMQGNGQFGMQGNGQFGMQDNGQFGMQRNDQSRMQYQSRPIRNQEPEHYVEDFDDFEEFDENFPVKIRANVEDLEFGIRKDLEFKYRLLTRLNDLGGKKYKKSIRLKMKYLFTDQVLEKYSWRGTAKKKAFKKLKSLNNLILRSVRDRCPNTEREEYNDYMIQWLKHARSRQRKVTYTYPARGNSNSSSEDSSDDENMN